MCDKDDLNNRLWIIHFTLSIYNLVNCSVLHILHLYANWSKRGIDIFIHTYGLDHLGGGGGGGGQKKMNIWGGGGDMKKLWTFLGGHYIRHFSSFKSYFLRARYRMDIFWRRWGGGGGGGTKF